MKRQHNQNKLCSIRINNSKHEKITLTIQFWKLFIFIIQKSSCARPFLTPFNTVTKYTPKWKDVKVVLKCFNNQGKNDTHSEVSKRFSTSSPWLEFFLKLFWKKKTCLNTDGQPKYKKKSFIHKNTHVLLDKF